MNDPIQDLLNVHEDVHFETDILNDWKVIIQKTKT